MLHLRHGVESLLEDARGSAQARHTHVEAVEGAAAIALGVLQRAGQPNGAFLSESESNSRVGQPNGAFLSDSENNSRVGQPNGAFLSGQPHRRMQFPLRRAENAVMQLFHVTIASVDRRALFIDDATRRRAVRRLVRVVGPALILFCVVDDHVHVVLAVAAARVAYARMALARTLQACTHARLSSHASPVENRAHLIRLVPYILGQTRHHRLDAHPATWSGSCYHDLIGARLLLPLAEQIRHTLPRLHDDDLHRAVGLAPSRILPASDRDARLAGVDRVLDAAAFAVAADPDLRSRTTPCVVARRACVHLAFQVGLSKADITRALRQTPQRVGQLALEHADSSALRAIRLQLTIAALVRGE